MKSFIWIAALAGVAAATPAQAHHKHHGMHHHGMAMAEHRDSVSIDGKDYKVCSGAVQDDCVNPRQAGLNFGNEPTDQPGRHSMQDQAGQ